MDTIFSPASGRVKSAVAVVRLSGPNSCAALREITGGAMLPPPRHMSLRRILLPDGEVVDEGLVVWFAADASFTGEEAGELQLHGSPAVLDAVLRRLGSMAGLRHAEPGEFARRAFEAGRLDLAQVEGLADLIEAETEAQRRQAVRVAQGAVGKIAGRWRERLLRALALVEAGIDFSDQDLPEGLMEEVRTLLSDVRQELVAEIDGARMAERVRDGFEVAIVGRPNAGKSTLLNALAGREAALTSELAGTTRDVIEVRMHLDGLPVTILDTAGVREDAAGVEAMGVTRGLERARQADLRVFLLSDQLDTAVLQPRDEDIVVVGKADLQGGAAMGVSGLTGEGIDSLVTAIAEILSRRAAGAGVVVAARQQRALEACREALDSAATGIELATEAPELIAEDIRRGLGALERLVGRFDVEDVLDVVFSGFCIGK